MTFIKQLTLIKSDDIYETANLYQVRWYFLKAQGTSIACIFRKQIMFIKLQLLMSLSMNQFIQWFAI